MPISIYLSSINFALNKPIKSQSIALDCSAIFYVELDTNGRLSVLNNGIAVYTTCVYVSDCLSQQIKHFANENRHTSQRDKDR